MLVCCDCCEMVVARFWLVTPNPATARSGNRQREWRPCSYAASDGRHVSPTYPGLGRSLRGIVPFDGRGESACELLISALLRLFIAPVSTT